MTRAVLFDTETTGLDPLGGDRVIEFAALELWNDMPTGLHLHLLIDPERDIPEAATRIHGLTSAHFQGKPPFDSVADQIHEFFGESRLIAHNAAFDFGFMNAEFGRGRRRTLSDHRMVDTLALAKSRFPGLPNSLDALCRRFGIDLSQRTRHSALLDCRLLADVYLELIGGRQRGMVLEAIAAKTTIVYVSQGPRKPVPIIPSTEELAAHAVLLSGINSPLWDS